MITHWNGLTIADVSCLCESPSFMFKKPSLWLLSKTSRRINRTLSLRLFLQHCWLLGSARSWVNVSWTMKHLKAVTLCHLQEWQQRLPSRGLLRVWHLFLFSLSNLALVLSSLPPSTSRSPCWQGAGVNSWSLPLEWSAPTARLWPSFTVGTARRLSNRFPLSFPYIAKNAYMAAICQVLRRCWVREPMKAIALAAIKA